MKWKVRGFITREIINSIERKPLNLDYSQVSESLRRLTIKSVNRLEKLKVSEGEHGKGVIPMSIDSIIHSIHYLSKEDRALLWEFLDLKYDILPKAGRIYVDESNNPWGPEDDYWVQEYIPNERDEQAEQDLETINEYLEFNRINNKVASVEGFREWREANNKVFNSKRLNEC